jgi:hypothetical protein
MIPMGYESNHKSILENVLTIVGVVLVIASIWAVEIAKEYAKQKNNG